MEGKSRKTVGALAVLLLFQIPGCVKFADYILTAYTAPTDAKDLGASMLGAAEALSDWPWWMVASLSIGSLGLYALYLFGVDGMLRAGQFLYRRDMRQAELRNIADDAELTRLREQAENELRVQRNQAAIAEQKRTGEYQRLLGELSEYLEMLEAEHKLDIFDFVLPGFGIPAPPQKTDDEQSDNHRWSNFFMSIGEVNKDLCIFGEMRGLNLLPSDACARINQAGENATPSKLRPEEKGVAWPSDEGRMQWLVHCARIEQYQKERTAVKAQLDQNVGELPRAKKAEQIRRLLQSYTE